MSEKLFSLKLTEWEKDAILTIIGNATFQGKDVEAVTKLINTIKNSVEE